MASALNALAGVVEPSYGFAMDACIARQALIADAAEGKELSVPEAQRQLHGVREKCHAVRNSFELIRRTHDEARALLESGQVAQAQRKLDAIVSEWRGLQGEGAP